MEIEKPDFPTYVSPILNRINDWAHGTRPEIVGKVTELIEEFGKGELTDWENWYLKRHADKRTEATRLIREKLDEVLRVMAGVRDSDIELWVRDLVITQTYIGLRLQRAILIKVAEVEGKNWRLASPEEESMNIDGYIGDEPISVKPITYRETHRSEEIPARLIFYQKERDHVLVTF